MIRSTHKSVKPIPATMRNCVPDALVKDAAFISPATLIANSWGNCYPLSNILYFSLPSSFSSSQTSVNDVSSQSTVSSCVRASFTLKFLGWFFNSGFLTAATESFGLVRLTDDPSVRSSLQDKLNRVTCNGQSILTIFPMYWTKPSLELQICGIVSVSLFVPVFLFSLFLLYKHRRRAIIRSSGLVFNALTLLGQVLFIFSALAWTRDISDSSCHAFLWLGNLGFTLG
jgi:hypothetical protein